jgi:hypothetical protein
VTTEEVSKIHVHNEHGVGFMEESSQLRIPGPQLSTNENINSDEIDQPKEGDQCMDIGKINIMISLARIGC